MVSSNLSLRSLLRIKIDFLLLSLCTDELIPVQNITFLPNSLSLDNEKLPCVLNPIPYPEYLYLPKSALFTDLAATNKKFTKIKAVLYLYGHKLQCGYLQRQYGYLQTCYD